MHLLACLLLVLSFCNLSAAVAWTLPYYEPPATAAGTRYDVGPGQAYAELDDVPWLSLAAGDVVLIHHRDAPYRAVFAIKTQATTEHPLRIYGVRDPTTGAIPVISADGAVTASAGQTAHLAGLGLRGGQTLAIVDYGGQMPTWIEIANLEFQDARLDSTFTDTAGSANYGGFPCSIWSRAKHVAIKGCRFINNGIGVFTQCHAGVAGSSEDTLIEGCDFADNGNIGHSTEHNIYSQGISSTIQFCRVGRLIGPGSAIKDRGAGTVIRYNLITSSARALDLVEPEEYTEEITALPTYGQDYVYGNIIINDINAGGSGNMIHYGADNDWSRARKGTLHFYNNTISIQSGMTYTAPYTEHANWRVNIFQITDNAARIEAYNNIFSQLQPTTPPEAWGPSNLNIIGAGAGDVVGTVDFLGGNWIRSAWCIAHDDYPAPDTGHHVVQSAPLVTGQDPLFVDFLTDPTLGAASPCRNIAVALPASLTSTHPVLFQCGAPPTARTSLHDAGAFEGAASPAIAVTRNGHDIADGGTETVTGSTPGTTITLTYAIGNPGGDTLSIGEVGSIPGTNCTVSVTTAPDASVAAGSSTMLVLSVTPTAAGAWSFPISFATNVAGRNPEDWTVSGSASTSTAEIAVDRGGATIVDGGTDAITGSTAGSTFSLTYTIANTGTAVLTLGSIGPITGTNCTVVITTAPASSIAVGTSSALVVEVAATAVGAWSFPVSFATNDADEDPTSWTISGNAREGGSGGHSEDGGGGNCGFGAAALLLAPLLLVGRLRIRHGAR